MTNAQPALRFAGPPAALFRYLGGCEGGLVLRKVCAPQYRRDFPMRSETIGILEPKLRYQLKAAPSQIVGRRLRARSHPRPAQARRGFWRNRDLAGGRARTASVKRIALVEFEDGYALDANHKVEFYTLRALKQGEELTANYGETHHDGKHPCH